MNGYALLIALPFLIVLISASPSSANFNSLPPYVPALVGCAVTALFSFLFYKRPVAKSRMVTLFLMAGLLIRIIYWSDTPHDVRANDEGGHVEMLKITAKAKALPKSDACWECYQPPLYYVMASPVCALTSCEKSSLMLLQGISFILSLGFLLVGIKIFRLFLPERDERYFVLASALLIFWPSAVIESVKINNDILLFFLAASGFYFLCLWLKAEKLRHIAMACIFSLLAVLTKVNGVILFGIVLIAFFLKVLLKKEGDSANSLKKHIYPIAIIACTSVFILLFLFSAYGQYSKLSDYKGKIVGNVSGLAKGLEVKNEAKNFISFDAKKFIYNFADPWSDKGGRQYLANYALKTSLFGEFDFWQTPLKNQMALLSVLAMFIFIFMFFGLAYSAGGARTQLSLLIATSMVINFVALALNRYVYPFSCSADFRYIFPVLIPAIAALCFGVKWLFDSKCKFLNAIGSFGEYAAWFFVISSAVFFASLVVL